MTILHPFSGRLREQSSGGASDTSYEGEASLRIQTPTGSSSSASAAGLHEMQRKNFAGLGELQRIHSEHPAGRKNAPERLDFRDELINEPEVECESGEPVVTPIPNIQNALRVFENFHHRSEFPWPLSFRSEIAKELPLKAENPGRARVEGTTHEPSVPREARTPILADRHQPSPHAFAARVEYWGVPSNRGKCPRTMRGESGGPATVLR